MIREKSELLEMIKCQANRRFKLLDKMSLYTELIPTILGLKK
jgi:hypothetical protein